MKTIAPQQRQAGKSCSGWLQLLVMLSLVCIAPPVLASTTRLQMTRVAVGDLDLRDVQFELQQDRGQASVLSRIDAMSFRGTRVKRMQWRCDLSMKDAAFACRGPLSLDGRQAGELELGWDGLANGRWRQGRAEVRLAVDGSGDVTATIRQLSLKLLQPVLSKYAPGLLLGEGQLEGRIDLLESGDRIALDLHTRAGHLDSTDGRIAAAGIDADLRAELSGLRQGVVAGVELGIEAGEVLFGSLYAPIAKGTRAHVRLRQPAGADAWVLDSARFADTEGTRAELAGTWSDAGLGDWRIDVSATDLARSSARYLDSVLATAGMPGATWQGRARLAVRGSGERVDMLTGELDGLALAEPAARIALDGLSGTLGWVRDGAGMQGELRWAALRPLDIEMGEGALQWRAAAGAISLRQPLRLHPFGGEVQLAELDWRPLESRLAVRSEFHTLDLAAMMQRFGWPAIPGRLSGRLPLIRYADAVLESEGALQIEVLDGSVKLSGLRMERPFGLTPSFGADIEFDDLDLSPLTGAFGFGEITGRLDGYVHGLRMLDWSPVAFDARLITDGKRAGKQRISQRAVQDLSNVGGGLIAGLQNQVLRLFDSFAYKRIGLSCRLENNICHMGGLDSSAHGYTVVEGAGLPRITVNGFQQRVDWPVLLARLKAATSGNSLRIEQASTGG